MTKQQKARAHLARAQELLQGHGSSPYNTRPTASNEALGFGTGTKMAGVTAQDTERSAQDLAYKGLHTDVRTIIESKLDNNQNWNLALSGKEISVSYEPYRMLRKGWIDDKASVMADADLVRRASIFSPKVFGYAAESLQNNKALATEMFEKDPESLNAYLSALDELPQMFDAMLQSKDFAGIEKMWVKKLNVPNDDWWLTNLPQADELITKDELLKVFKVFMRIERDRRSTDISRRIREIKFGRDLVDQERSWRRNSLQISYENLKGCNESLYRTEKIRETLEAMKEYEYDPKLPSIFTS